MAWSTRPVPVPVLRVGCPCGIGNYLAMAGLDFDRYLMEPMFSMNFDGLVAKTPLCTINKPLLLRILYSDSPCTGNHWESAKPNPMMLSWMQPGYSGQFCLPADPTSSCRPCSTGSGWNRPETNLSRQGCTGTGSRDSGTLWIFLSGMGSTISVLAGFILTSTRASCNGFTRRTLIGLPSLRSAAAEE